MKITAETEKICSCLDCGAKNYLDLPKGQGYTNNPAVKLQRIALGPNLNMIVTLCNDCLGKLSHMGTVIAFDNE